MELFRGRPMACIGTAAIAAALLGWYLTGTAKLVPAAAACILLAAVITARVFGKISERRAVTAALCLAAVACVLFRAYRYYDVKYLGSASLCDAEHDFSLVIDERLPSGGFSSRYNVCVESIDGEPSGGIRARFECSYSADFRPGDRISLRTAPIPFEKTSLYDSERAALGDWITMNLSVDAECDITENGSLRRPIDILRRFSSRLAFRLADGVGGDEGALAAAMLLGDRSGLSDAVSRDFSRAGLSHLLALSGLHLSVIAGAVGWLLGRLRLPKIVKTPLMVVFLFIYLALTGFLISTVRAAIMLITVFRAYFSGADGDGVSSVFFAALLILSVSPWAIVDVGFVLSFSATLGITVFLPAFNNRRHRPRQKMSARARRAASFFDKAAALLLTGLSANCFTVPVIWWIFGEISIAAPISNLLIAPLAAPFLAFSIVFLPLAGIPVFGAASAFAVRLTARVMLGFCALVSDIRGAVVSLEYGFVPYIIIPAAAATAVMLTLKLRRKIFCFAPALAAAAAFAVCLITCGDAAGTRVSFVRTGENDAIIATCRGSAIITDIGSGSYDILRASAAAADMHCASETEALILTHYHKRHIAGVERFFGREKVRSILLPYPRDAADAEILEHIYDSARRMGVKCAVYTPGDAIPCFGSITVTADAPEYIARSAQPLIAVTVRECASGKELRYIGASAWESTGFALNDGCDAVIFGSHGPTVKNAADAAPPVSLREAVIASPDAAGALAGMLAQAKNKVKITLSPEVWEWRG